MFSNIFKNKKILVTGHTGFKGSWACIWLHYLGANIVGISDRVKTKPSHFEAVNLKKYLKDIRLDLRDTVKLNAIINDFSPDFIFHFAAQSLVSKSFINPEETYSTNIFSTLNLLEALKNLNSKVTCIFVTSDKVYDNLEWPWGYRETDALGGKDPYSASKASCELIIKSYFHSFLKEKKIKIGIGRAGNVIGGGDWNEDRLVPDCIKSWSKSKKVVVRSPNATRPWQHVLEPISGYFSIAQNLYQNDKNNGEAFNFGPNTIENFDVKYLIDNMKFFGENAEYIIEERNKKFLKEANLLKLNCDKAALKLNWKPVLNFKNTIDYTMSWYLEFYKGKSHSMYDYTCKQIKNYHKQAQKKKLFWS